MFFAPKDAYSPCGVYTAGHFVSLLICFALLVLLLILFRNTDLERLYFYIRRLAVILTVLEAVKIGHNFYYGYTNIDSWVPLSFCSLFIYACYMSGYGSGKIREAGDAFFVVGGIVAGIVFISMPTTSLTMYPLFHFQSVYSMIFHTLMVAVGILMLRRGKKPTVRLFCRYAAYFLSFAALALSINLVFRSNLMTFREPYKLPFEFLHILQGASQTSYTALAVLAHLILPYTVACIVNRLCPKRAQE